MSTVESMAGLVWPRLAALATGHIPLQILHPLVLPPNPHIHKSTKLQIHKSGHFLT
jgi:hypothetical protein